MTSRPGGTAARTTSASARSSPLGRLYGWIAERRYRRRQPYRSRLPVICVGNFTAGGTGKTPLSLFIARQLIARGQRPVFLTRGYGGRTAGPAGSTTRRRRTLSATSRCCSPRVAPTVVARDRRAGIIAIETRGRDPSVVIMDDGLQNPAVAKDLTIALVDGKRGIGNGEVIPAGPLRAPLDFQLGLVDAIVVRDPPSTADERERACGAAATAFPGPVLAAQHRAAPATRLGFRRKPLVAFAGIANPQRFYKLLETLGRQAASNACRSPITTPSRAPTPSGSSRWRKASGAQLVTTEKDFARMARRCRAGRAGRANAHAADRLDVRRRAISSRLSSLIERGADRARRGGTVRRRSASIPRARARACRASADSAASRPPASRTPPAARRSSSAGRAA